MPISWSTYDLPSAVLARCSTRAFAKTEIDELTLRRLAEVVRWSPSSMNAQPWRLCFLSRALDPVGHAAILPALVEGNRRWAHKAPLFVVVCTKTDLPSGSPNRSAELDAGIAVGMLLLSLKEFDLVARPMGGFDADALSDVLSLPQNTRPMAVLAIGFPGAESELPEDLRAREALPRERLPQQDFVFGATFGEPLRTSKDWQTLHRFWFGTLDGDGLSPAKVSAQWFASSASFDSDVRERFEGDHRLAKSGELDHWTEDTHGTIALILLLDQVPRNIYRGKREAFATDSKALTIALDALDHRRSILTTSLSTEEWCFLLLPLMHSENLDVQQRCVAEFQRFTTDARTPRARERYEGSLRFAEEHRRTIELFGRFPARNEALDRTSTAAEMAFLSQHES